MIVVDTYRCTYCGGCVSVCPVQALTLAETQLVVDERCTDCEDCVSACPVGALRPQFADRPAAQPAAKRKYDVVVVGAGPGGSTAARTAAEAGLSVLLLEKRQEIGSPVRCAEGVTHERLRRFVEPDPKWISTRISQVDITAIGDGRRKSFHASGGQGYVLERRVFDRVLAERAALAGAEVRVKTAAAGLIFESEQVCGVQIERGDFFGGADQVQVQCRIVIGADGVESQIGCWAGLEVALPLHDTMVCAQYLLAGIDVDPTCTYYTIDQSLAPGGYCWVFPKGDRTANVGLGIQADLWQKQAAASSIFDSRGAAAALRMLDRFVESDSRLAKGYPVTLIAGVVPVAPSPRSVVADGLMLIGDAARQVDPLTGGGILNAMEAGEVAGRTAAQAIAAGDTSATFLRRYETEWQRSVGHRLERNYRLRERFPADRRADDRFIQAFALSVA